MTKVLNNCEGCLREHKGQLPPSAVCDACQEVSEDTVSLKEADGSVLDFYSAGLKQSATDPARLLDLRRIKR